MSKFNKDPFSSQYKPTDRKSIDEGISAFLSKGGKVTKLKDSDECEEILRRRDRKQKAAERRADKDNPCGVIGGMTLGSKLDVLTVRDE